MKTVRIRILTNGSRFRVQVRKWLEWHDHFETKLDEAFHDFCGGGWQTWPTREKAEAFVRLTYGKSAIIDPRPWTK